MSDAAVCVTNLCHQYGERTALVDVTLEIAPGEVFVFLGPNGSGKSTLFRILSTLMSPRSGKVAVLGRSLPEHVWDVRSAVGIVFQMPSLDRKLTVLENLRHQAALYGIRRNEFRIRVEEQLRHFGLWDRRNDLIEKLSGGLRRRVELAKGLIHRPRLLLMDEPSTGLDPGARTDMWEFLSTLQRDQELTIVLTTHLLDEAERADRIAILDQGQLVAVGTPDELRASVGGDSISIQTSDPASLASDISRALDCNVTVVEGLVRIEQANGHQWIPRLVESFPQRIDTITLGKPTLGDVFMARTGRRLKSEDEGLPIG